MDQPTLQFYQCNAKDMAEKYNSATGGICDYFAQSFCPGSRVLDIGCGSGRDLNFLLESGYDAFGVDACREFIHEAENEFPHVSNRIFHDRLPELESISEDSYDGVVCSAVLMHLPEDRLFDAVWSIKKILKPNGTLLVSLPVDDTIVNNRDITGRLFNGLLPDKLQLLLERIGFQEIKRWQNSDSLGRSQRQWVVQLFRLNAGEGSRSIDRIEAVLNRDNKVATYKLALFRALAELAQTNYNLAIWRVDGKVLIPLEAIAEKWVEYYWPIFANDSVRIPQTTGKQLAFRGQLEDLIDCYRGNKGGLAKFCVDYRSNQLPPEIVKIHSRMFSKLKQTIWNQPVRYAGGGEDFSVFGYDKQTRNVVLDADMWRELSLTGSWIKDATILRWAELTARINNKKMSKDNKIKEIRPSQVIDLLLIEALPERDVYAAKTVYDELSDKFCVWSDTSLKAKYDVDHAIPYSLWYNNDLWNLFPASSSSNNSKRDKLPSRELIINRKDAMVHYWEILKNAFPVRFDYEMGHFCGTGTDGVTNWENTLFQCFAEAVEFTACQRGVERWQPDCKQSVGQVAEEKKSKPEATESLVESVEFIDYDEVATAKYKRALPLVGDFAAGQPFRGFDVDDLAFADENLPWVEVPGKYCRNRRFVIKVVGDSMEPTIVKGDYVVCEYHRHNQEVHKVVIMGDFSYLSAGEEAVKRIKESEEAWIFRSDNPKYEDIIIEKDADEQYPILGTIIYNLTQQCEVK